MKKWLVLALAFTALTACGPRPEQGGGTTASPASPAVAGSPGAPGGPPPSPGGPPPSPGGPPPSPGGSPGGPGPIQVTEEDRKSAGTAKVTGDHQEAKLKVTKDGFEPKVLKVQAGIPVRLTVLRETEDTCATDFSMPAQGVEKKALELKKDTLVEFTAFGAGEYPFGCGGDPMKVAGLLVVEGESVPGGPGGPPPSPGGPGGPPPSPGGPPPSPAGGG